MEAANLGAARMRRVALLLCALLLSAVPLLAACGVQDVDRAELEAQVQRSLQSQTVARISVRSVSCPDRLKAQQGAQTRCTITTTEGKTVGALVTVTGTANHRVQFDLKLEQNPTS
jgi:hypothetical protein